MYTGPATLPARISTPASTNLTQGCELRWSGNKKRFLSLGQFGFYDRRPKTSRLEDSGDVPFERELEHGGEAAGGFMFFQVAKAHNIAEVEFRKFRVNVKTRIECADELEVTSTPDSFDMAREKRSSKRNSK